MLPRLYNTLASFKSARLGGCIQRIGGHVSGRESVHGAVPVSAALTKPVVVAVPVHRVTDPHEKCTPEKSRFAVHLARRPRFPGAGRPLGSKSKLLAKRIHCADAIVHAPL